MSEYTKEQVEEIREGAGGHRQLYLSWRFPFLRKVELVFGGNCGLCGKWNWQWCEKGWEWTAPCKECIKEYKSSLVIVEVELAHGVVNDVFRDFKPARDKVERSRPSRWYNPVLVAVDREVWSNFEYTGECEINQLGCLEELVVAVPDIEWGYGNKYRGLVEVNRARLSLK